MSEIDSPSSEVESVDPPASQMSEEDVLDLAARAILGYLEELASCRELCLRLASSVRVRPSPEALHLVAAIERTPQGERSHLREALEQLTSAGLWRRNIPCEQPTLMRHVVWEGQPLLVVVLDEGWGRLRVEMLLPNEEVLPSSALQRAARGLRLLEYLMSPHVARPAEAAQLADPPPLSLIDSLERARPEGETSSQCIWQNGAAPCPSPAEPSSPTA